MLLHVPPRSFLLIVMIEVLKGLNMLRSSQAYEVGANNKACHRLCFRDESAYS